MKLFSLLIPSLFIVTSVYALDSVTPVSPTQKEARRDLLSKIESTVNNHDYLQIEAWSEDSSLTTSLTQQDLKPLLAKCAAQVKWTDYVKKYRNTALKTSGNILASPGETLEVAGIWTFILPGLLFGALFLPPSNSGGMCPGMGSVGLVMINPLNLLTLPVSAPLFILGKGLSYAGNGIKEAVPTKDVKFLTYIAIKKLYHSLPTGISRHHKTHKHAHRKR